MIVSGSVPKSPSENALREAGRSFNGYPVDMAIFDSPQHRGEWDHVLALVETKAPNHKEGISELSTYLGLEPNAVLGIWSDGNSISLVYKQSRHALQIGKTSNVAGTGG